MLSRQHIQAEIQAGLLTDSSLLPEPSSIDLHLDFVIDYKESGEEAGVVRTGQDSTIALAPGRIVTLVSKETVNMPDKLGAIIFLPNKIAQEGILAFNAVHVDPGFRGRLNLRVLNLSGQDYCIEPGMPFATLLIFKLTKRTDKPFDRNKKDPEYLSGLEAIVLRSKGMTYAPPDNVVEDAVRKVLPAIIRKSPATVVLVISTIVIVVLTFLIVLIALIQTVSTL